MLSLIAKVNRKPMLTGRLVTAEEKEQLFKKRNCSPLLEESETNGGDVSYGTLPDMEISAMTDFTIVSSDNGSDSELLLDEHTHRRKWITNKLVNYYHWVLILFKNGWWRTTLLLWFIW